MNILLLNGPNLNLLGEREPHIYGTTTLAQLEQQVAARAAALGHTLRAAQSNHEGVLIDELHQARFWANGCIFNPGAFTHSSWALRDAVSAVTRVRVVEVHLSDPSRREAFRHLDVFDGVVAHKIVGKGIAGYLEALEWLSQ